MLCVATTDYQTSWFLEFTIGAHTDTFDNDFLVFDRTAAEAAETLADWMSSGLRPWGATTWSWELTPDPAGSGGAYLTLTGSTSATITDSSPDGGPLGLEAGTAGTTLTGTMRAAGTFAPRGGVAVRRRYPRGWAGDASGTAAVMPGCPGTMANHPDVSAVVTPLEAGRLAEVLRSAVSPRWGHVRDHLGEWIPIQLGKVDRAAAGYSFYRVNLEAAEER